MPVTTIRATEVGEFIRHNSCERRFKLEYDKRTEAKKLPFAIRFFNSIDPVLQEAGRKREEDWENYLKRSGLLDFTGFLLKPATLSHNDKKTDWADFVALVNSTVLVTGQSAYGREIEIEGTIGAFPILGRMDFVLILWNDGKPKLRIVECKASRRDRTYHRIQVAIYRLLVSQNLSSNPIIINGITLTPNDIECVVARIDESTNQGQDILNLPPLNLDLEQEDIELLLASNGTLETIVNTPVDVLDFQLSEKCDGCVFSVHCLAESARERRLELLGLEPSTIRAIRTAGIADIDELAALDLTGAEANQLRSNQAFSSNLAQLKQLAGSRSTTLPNGSVNPDSYPVQSLPNVGDGQLPLHVLDGEQLVRIYLSVDYDYVENRIGAICAHVTRSNWQLHTDKTWNGTTYDYDPVVKERRKNGLFDSDGKPLYEEKPLESQEVIKFKSSPWTGRYSEDTGSERELIQGFLRDLIDTIAEVAEVEWAPIHFYVWSKSEIAHLVEACARVGSGLLGALRELLGCRESLEQLIYSSLKDEVDSRFALGWTSRGLAVASSLTWFGRQYHWTRRIAGRQVQLDHVFEQDIFDFKTTLKFKSDGSWFDEKKDPLITPLKHKFEIRSRFNDSLSAPYWRAYWGELDATSPGLDSRVRDAITRYNQAAQPRYLLEYFRARVHSLRWIEENIQFKNSEIRKPLLNISQLRNFNLNVNNTAQAAIDFLRLDQFVSTTEWIASHLTPPANRVPTGRTIPITNIVVVSDNEITAEIDLTGYDIDYSALEARCSFIEGSFVRLTISSNNPNRGQSFKQLTSVGSTCVIEEINWSTRQIRLSSIVTGANRYQLSSFSFKDLVSYFTLTHATIDESRSNFVSGKVEARLLSGLGSYAYDWLDPITPNIPPIPALSPSDLSTFELFLQTLQLPPNNDNLALDQQRSIIEGLSTKIQLLQGPPGTGKTTTSAIATLLRILARRNIGDIVLVAATTHPAIDTLLRKLDQFLPAFAQHARNNGISMPAVTLSKVHSSQISNPFGGSIEDLSANTPALKVRQMRRDSVLVIGGTTSAILKMTKKLNESANYRNNPERFQVPALIVDEASMMVFPDFLSLVTLVERDGEIMVIGDHRQLTPIISHEWDREDRPPVVLYQPYVSAYEAVQRIKQNFGTMIQDESILLSSLSYTFRLPAEIRDLIGRLYRLDDINLQGSAIATSSLALTTANALQQVWSGRTGLYLVLHNERESKQSNETEANIIEQILNLGGARASDSIAIVTPHRAQRTLLKTQLDSYLGASVGVIDTVERLQGGERPIVIVSATASDPTAISASAKFILDLNRSNVAFSRTQERLIVVVSETLLNYIPAEYESYQSTLLWKSLRSICSNLVGVENVGGFEVKVLTLPTAP